MALGPVILLATLTATSRWVTLTASATGATEISIYRAAGDAAQAVRGAYKKPVSGTLVAADYEAPQNTALSYYAVATDGVMTFQSPVVTVDGIVDRGGDAVFGMTNPLAWLIVNVEGIPELDSPGRVDLVQVIGRPDPVAVSDIRTYPSGTLTLITLEAGERVLLNRLLADGGLLAFSPHHPEYGFADVWYLAVKNVRERRTSTRALEQSRRFDLDVQRVAAPPADFIGPAFRTWGDVYTAGTTWGDVYTAGTTWLQAMVSDA